MPKNLSQIAKSKKIKSIFSTSIEGLAHGNLDNLKKNKKSVEKLSEEVEDLRNDLFYFIKNLDEDTIKAASNFYINMLTQLQDITESLQYISKITYKHVNNNHKLLTYNQIKELLEINSKCSSLYDDIKNLFSVSNFGELKSILERKQEFVDFLQDKIDIQISRTKKEESSPKNTTLYFSLLIETKEMIENTMSLLELYDNSLKNK